MLIKKRASFMGKVEVKVSEASSISKIKTDILVLKNTIDGVYGPEKEVDLLTSGEIKKLNKKEFCRVGKIIQLKGKTENLNKILLMGLGEIDLVDYESIRFAYNQAFNYISGNFPECKTVTTVAHGVGFGLSKKDVFIQLVRALIDADGDFNLNFDELIINENGITGEPEIISYIENLNRIGPTMFLKENNKFYIDLNKKYIKKETEVFTVKEKIKRLIIQGKILDAIDQLRGVDSKVYQDEVDILESRYRNLKSDQIAGLIDVEYHNLELNRIKKGILDVLKNV